jgi:hypothetical protein
MNETIMANLSNIEDAFQANVAALKALANVAHDIRDCYADVIGTDSCPGWIEDLDHVLHEADAALRRAEVAR